MTAGWGPSSGSRKTGCPGRGVGGALPGHWGPEAPSANVPCLRLPLASAHCAPHPQKDFGPPGAPDPVTLSTPQSRGGFSPRTPGLPEVTLPTPQGSRKSHALPPHAQHGTWCHRHQGEQRGQAAQARAPGGPSDGGRASGGSHSLMGTEEEREGTFREQEPRKASQKR